MMFFAALAVGAFVLGAMPAHATDASPAHPRVHTRVTGTYVVTTAPGSEVLGVFDTAGSVTSTFDASPSQRVLPATLTQATLGPFVTPCSDTGDGRSPRRWRGRAWTPRRCSTSGSSPTC